MAATEEDMEQWLHLEFPWDFMDIVKNLNTDDTLEMNTVTSSGEEIRLDISRVTVEEVSKVMIKAQRHRKSADLSKMKPPVTTFSVQEILSPVYLSQHSGVAEEDKATGDGSDALVIKPDTAENEPEPDPPTHQQLLAQSAPLDEAAEGTENEIEQHVQLAVEGADEASGGAIYQMGPSGDYVLVKGESGGESENQIITQLAEGGIGKAEGGMGKSEEVDLQKIVSQFIQNGDSSVTIVTNEEEGRGEEVVTQLTVDQEICVVCPECSEIFPADAITTHLQEVHGDSPNSQEWQNAVLEQLMTMKLAEAAGKSDPETTVENGVIDAAGEVVIHDPSQLAEQQADNKAIIVSDSGPLMLDMEGGGSRLHHCYLCPSAFRKLKSLSTHLERSHDEELDPAKVVIVVDGPGIKCHLCDFIGSDKMKIRRHLRTVHSLKLKQQKQEAECYICQAKLTDLNAVRSHIRRNHKAHPMFEDALVKAWPEASEKRITGEFPCPECLKIFPISYVRKHLRQAHSDSPSLENGLRFIRSKLLQHRVQMRGVRRKPIPRVQCQHCGKSVLQTSLRLHMHSKHQIVIRKPLVQMVCPYEGCGKVFVKKYNKDRHMLTAHQKNSDAFKLERTKCPDCHVIITKPKLESHRGNRRCLRRMLQQAIAQDPSKAYLLKRAKKPIPSVKCDECGQKVLKTSMRIHMFAKHKKVIRTPVDIITCQYEGCGKTFIKKYNYERHRDHWHLGKRRLFPCDICGKQFTAKHSVEKHKKAIHEGLSQFCCEHCGQNFSQKAYLSKHLQLKEETGECQPPMRRRKRKRNAIPGSLMEVLPGGLAGVVVKEEPESLDGDSAADRELKESFTTEVPSPQRKRAKRKADNSAPKETNLSDIVADLTRFSPVVSVKRIKLPEIKVMPRSDAAKKPALAKTATPRPREKPVHKLSEVVIKKEPSPVDDVKKAVTPAVVSVQRSSRTRTPKKILDL